VISQRKLLIVANGLREQTGHYFETSVALAEAARRAGCQCVLGAHAECPPDLLPPWLDNHRFFRTDHWMREAVAAPCNETVEGQPSASGDAECGAALPLGPSSIARPSARQTAVGAARLAKLATRYAMPPLAYDAARVFVRYCLPRTVRGSQRRQARQDLQTAASRWKYGRDAELAQQAAHWPAIAAALDDARLRPRLLDALRRLSPLGLLAELEYALLFRQDLDRFLKAADPGPDDHVLLTTSHARELLAVHLIAEQFGLDASPTFHLEFRHPLFEGETNAHCWERSPGAVMQRAFLLLHAEWGTSQNVRFYTDAEALARDYESISGLRFDVLPLPFRSELIPESTRHADSPLTIAYLGGARDEKGFPWLPNLIATLRQQNDAGRVRFLIQANISAPEHNPHSVAALERLRTLGGDDLEFVALEEGLPPDDYYRLFARADVVLLPYLPERYRACTSGVLAEALAAGVPAVVPKGTWLSSQLPNAVGETFEGYESFVEAVQRVIDGYPTYRAAAQACRPAWLMRHTPDAVVAAVLAAGKTKRKPESAVELPR